jgi:hypothetical protein
MSTDTPVFDRLNEEWDRVGRRLPEIVCDLRTLPAAAGDALSRAIGRDEPRTQAEADQGRRPDRSQPRKGRSGNPARRAAEARRNGR